MIPLILVYPEGKLAFQVRIQLGDVAPMVFKAGAFLLQAYFFDQVILLRNREKGFHGSIRAFWSGNTVCFLEDNHSALQRPGTHFYNRIPEPGS